MLREYAEVQKTTLGKCDTFSIVVYDINVRFRQELVEYQRSYTSFKFKSCNCSLKVQ